MWDKNKSGHVSTTARKRILARDDYACQQCGVEDAPFEIDHINNQRGPEYDKDTNLWVLCVPCHRVKTQREAARGRRKALQKAKMLPETHPGLKKKNI